MDERELHCEHNHEHGEDCDCATETIFITFDEEEEDVECNVVAVFDHKDQDYIAINPIESEEILIYKLIDTENSEEGMELVVIESDEEYGEVTEVFYEVFTEE